MAAAKLLVERIRHLLSRRRGITEKKMFGGVCFLLNGNMLVAVWVDSLIARVGAEQAEIALTEPDVREMDLTGRPMKGWIIVEQDGIDSDQQLTRWIDLSLTFVRTLPAK
jgi:TfoX/Sxy family transcriptional regulator of competence genes